MPQNVPEDFSELSRLTIDSGTLEDLVGRVTALAVRTLPGCDYAGLSLVSGNEVTTAAATEELVGEVDAAQYSTGEGPCLQAIRDDEVFRIPSTASDERFQKFSPKAKAAGVSSSLSLPLHVSGATIGALNLYSRTENGFDEDDETLAQALADQAAVILLNGQVYDRSLRLTEQLEEALETRTVIAKAIGILMHREMVTSDEAFAILKRTSQRGNIKLRTIAQAVVDEHVASIPD